MRKIILASAIFILTVPALRAISTSGSVQATDFKTNAGVSVAQISLDTTSLKQKQDALVASTGAIPASAITASTFGAGVYTFPSSLGVNNQYPAYRLDVNGAGNISGQAIVGGTLTVGGYAFSVGGSTLNFSGGTLAIGTTGFFVNTGTGRQGLVIRGASNAVGGPAMIEMQSSAADADTLNLGNISFVDTTNIITSVAGRRRAIIQGNLDGDTSNLRGGSISFLTAPGGANTIERLKINATGYIGIGTSRPYSKLTISSGTIRIDGNVSDSIFASGNIYSSGTYSGNGANLTGVTVFVSSEMVSGTSVASVSDLYLATATITNRGGRTQFVHVHFTINNAAGSARTYTYSIYKNGVKDSEGDYSQTASGTSTQYVAIDYHEPSSTVGAVDYCLVIRSSSATGAQTLLHPHIDVWEY